ncbi:MAG: hypothetical protein NC930_05485 [Candidatus Omnitrophica bacterium]|nr:hypothetical protein [Candidatus Omnitrophota bacterium]
MKSGGAVNVDSFDKRERNAVLLILCVGLLFTGVNFFTGYSADPDGYYITEKALAIRTDGFQRSRSFGFPLYELPVYLIIFYLGRTAGKFYSLFWYLASGILLFSILRKLKVDPDRACLAALSFMVMPVAVISGNSIMETSQGLSLALLSLYYFICLMESDSAPPSFTIYLMAISVGLATSTRLDYAILGISCGLTLSLHKRFPRITFVYACLVGLLVALLPYAGLYGWSTFSKPSVVIPDPLSRKLIRALFGVVALFGIPGFFMAVVAVGRCLIVKTGFVKPYLRFFFIVAVVLLAVRFVILPDVLRYIIILPALVILLMVRTVSKKILWLFVFAMALPNFVQFHLFRRDQNNFEIYLSPGFSPGALWQERSGRLKQEYLFLELPVLLDQVADRFGCKSYLPRLSLIKGVEYLNRFDCLIIPNEVRRFLKPGRLHNMFSGLKPRVIVYNIPDHRGWSQFFRHEDWTKIGLDDFKEIQPGHPEG